LVFEPGQGVLRCPYCSTENVIAEAPPGSVASEDYVAELHRLAADEPAHEALVVKCNSCAAQTTLAPDQTAGNCPFCGAPIVAEACSHKSIRPHSLLPFTVTSQQAIACFRQWVGRLWFAPSQLARNCERAAIHGTYLPAWTYDSNTSSDYTGERGDDYTVSETYTTIVNGRSVTQTRMVTRTRWTFVSGNVDNRFANILVMASASLPRHELDALQPWDLENLVPYGDQYLSGFVAESYQITLPQGFEAARQIMDVDIRRTVERDIGGNHQRISSLNTRYSDVAYKHLLVPTWISAYRWGAKVYRFLVNARTGKVRGERPYSAIKILLAVLAGLAAAALITWLALRGQ
jgi:ribosomal protein S27E